VTPFTRAPAQPSAIFTLAVDQSCSGAQPKAGNLSLGRTGEELAVAKSSTINPILTTLPESQRLPAVPQNRHIDCHCLDLDEIATKQREVNKTPYL
jgi:hypothetical protein